jgi:transketolase
MNNNFLHIISNSVRCLAMDAVQSANSGHPGLPLGLAELGALLFGEVLSHNPKDPKWLNRDRLILSAGHGSMWLYSLLHLSGYDLSIDDIKQFRQLHSRTPGHPEVRHTPGVEITTGPLGSGLASAVGMAIAETKIAARFNVQNFALINHYTYVVAGDGCLMEGLSSEACSLAGHLQLGKMIVFYDSNHITIEGNTDLAFTEDVAMRYQSYGWQVLHADAYDFDAMRHVIKQAQQDITHPSLIILKSIIGKGSPNKQGTHQVHGAPLGADEILAAKQAMSISDPHTPFFVNPTAYQAFADHQKELSSSYDAWQQQWQQWQNNIPDLACQWKLAFEPQSSLDYITMCQHAPAEIATRIASGMIINFLAHQNPCFIGGSADLAPSNNTYIENQGDYSANNRQGRNLHFGVREHAMGAIVNGINLYGGHRAFAATFLVFSDYMRPALRLAALMHIPSIFVFTHDSFFVGEDGPTHQPIEHIESLRLIPQMQVLRPSDAQETEWAWHFALSTLDKPSCICLSRQNLPCFPKSDNWRDDAAKGGYIAMSSKETPEIVLLATGSEVSLSMQVAQKLQAQGKHAHVIAVTERSILLQQNHAFLQKLMPKGSRVVAVEAGVGSGWYRLTPHVFSVEQFGLSGKAHAVADALHFNAEKLYQLCMQ